MSIPSKLKTDTCEPGTAPNRPTTPGRPAPKQPGELPDLTIYSVLDDGPDDTDPEPFKDATTQPAMHMPAEEANAIVSAVLASR